MIPNADIQNMYRIIRYVVPVKEGKLVSQVSLKSCSPVNLVFQFSNSGLYNHEKPSAMPPILSENQDKSVFDLINRAASYRDLFNDDQ